MSVIFVSRGVEPFSPVGGLERAVRWQIDALVDRGVEVKLITRTPDNFARRSMMPDVAKHWVAWPRLGGRSVRLNEILFGLCYLFWSIRVAFALRNVMQPGDVLHFHGASVFAACALRLMRLPAQLAIVHNPHGMEEFAPITLRNLPVRFVVRLMSRYGARRASVIQVTDNRLEKNVRKNFAYGKERFVLIPNGIALREFVHFRSDNSRLKFSGTAPIRLVSVGRLVHNKGYDLLASALVNIVSQDQGLRVSWLHFGTGPDERFVREIVQAGQVKHETRLSVEIRSGVTDDEVRRTVASSDMFVQPSRYEGSSLTTLEAMALGTVVVGAEVGGIPDKIVDGSTGFLFRPGDVDALADALRRSMHCDDVSNIRNRALALVESRFDTAAIADLYLDLYRSLGASAAEF